MILHEIVKHKRIQLEIDKHILPLETIKYALKHLPTYPVRDFKKAISDGEDIAIIGEIKKASPSRGIIKKDFNPLTLALEYAEAGVQALSILTEKKFFLGNDEYLCSVRQKCSLPILRKDFIIDPWQIYQSRMLGADAILLIASLLPEHDLLKFHLIAKMLGMCVLVEVHDRKELDMALSIDAEIIGINNRNLHDFSVDLKTTEELIRYVPEDKIVVSESGINNPEDVRYLKDLGVNALLIGEAFMRTKNIKRKVQSLRGRTQ